MRSGGRARNADGVLPKHIRSGREACANNVEGIVTVGAMKCCVTLLLYRSGTVFTPVPSSTINLIR
jgi:hypothetical protein